jgi:ribosomal protein S18 acetylase RimI-like enzyme
LSAIHVRPYIPADREAILALAPRFTVGIAPWLDPAAVLAAAHGWIVDTLASVGSTGAVFVATGTGDDCLGFVSVARRTHFTGEQRAYIGELAVVTTAESQGVGRALLTAAESWAHAQGFRAVELDTGAANDRARGFYGHLGYAEESVKLVKLLHE